MREVKTALWVSISQHLQPKALRLFYALPDRSVFCYYILHFLDFYVIESYNIGILFVCLVWLSLSIIILTFIHAAYINSLFLFITELYSIM